MKLRNLFGCCKSIDCFLLFKRVPHFCVEFYLLNIYTHTNAKSSKSIIFQYFAKYYINPLEMPKNFKFLPKVAKISPNLVTLRSSLDVVSRESNQSEKKSPICFSPIFAERLNIRSVSRRRRRRHRRLTSDKSGEEPSPKWSPVGTKPGRIQSMQCHLYNL